MLACGRSRTLASYKFRHGQWWWCSCHGTAVLHQEIEHFEILTSASTHTHPYIFLIAQAYIMHGWRGELIKCNILLFISHCSPVWKKRACHYYRNANLSDWETLFVPVSQPRTPGRDKKGVLLSCVRQPGQKAMLPAPRGWRTLLSRLVTFFPVFFFLNSFSISIILLHFN